MTIAELLEASREREQSFETLIDTIKAGTAIDRLRFAVNVCAMLDKSSGCGEAFTLLAQVTAKEDDHLVESFKALNKEDKMRATAKVLFLVEQDRLASPRKRHVSTNGETTVTDLILNAIQSAKGPITRAEVLAKVQEIMPDVNEKTVQGVISGKKIDGTLKHHEELHAYTIA